MLQVCLLVQWIFESMDVWTRFEMLSKWRQFKAQWIMGTRIRSRSGSSVIILYLRNRRLWRSSTENLHIRKKTSIFALRLASDYVDLHSRRTSRLGPNSDQLPISWSTDSYTRCWAWYGGKKSETVFTESSIFKPKIDPDDNLIII